jgi:hypothetical protein
MKKGNRIVVRKKKIAFLEMLTQIKAHKQEEATFSKVIVVTMIHLTMKSLLKT